MARVCYFTGKKTKSGNSRSHSMRATKRSFKPNLINKWGILEDGSKVRVKINSNYIRNSNDFSSILLGNIYTLLTL